MGILTEEFQSRLAVVAEAVEMLDEKMERRFVEAEGARKSDYNFLVNVCAWHAKALAVIDTKLDTIGGRLDEHDVILATLSR